MFPVRLDWLNIIGMELIALKEMKGWHIVSLLKSGRSSSRLHSLQGLRMDRAEGGGRGESELENGPEIWSWRLP